MGKGPGRRAYRYTANVLASFLVIFTGLGAAAAAAIADLRASVQFLFWTFAFFAFAAGIAMSYARPTRLGPTTRPGPGLMARLRRWRRARPAPCEPIKAWKRKRTAPSPAGVFVREREESAVKRSPATR